MPCGICHIDGHRRTHCPHMGIQGKFVYHIVCLILANYETTWGSRRTTSMYGFGTITNFAAKLFKSMSAEAIRELRAYLVTHFKEQYESAFQHTDTMSTALTNKAKETQDRKICEFTLVCIATITPYRNTVFAGLPLTQVHDILNTPEIMENNHFKHFRIWKCLGVIYMHPWISQMTFRHMSEAVRPSMRKASLKVYRDASITIPHDYPNCPICIEPFTITTVAKLDCGHFVCAPCMYQCEEVGSQKHINCCLCRTPVTTLLCAHVR